MSWLGYTETRSYNERLQLTRLTASGVNLPSVDLEYRYSATQNNGRITQEKNWVSGEEVTYQYDELQRLVSATTTGPEWGLNFRYDGFGNKLAQTGTKGMAVPQHSVVVNPANNRIASWSYDLNGNATQMGAGTPVRSYDVENRLEISGGYNLANQRVYDGTHYTFWSPDGKKLGKYTIREAFGQEPGAYWHFDAAETQVYLGGRLIAYGPLNAFGSFTPVVTDRLGSVRARGTQQMSYWPYGEERTATANGQDKFGTYLRDAGGVDYADQRYYASNLGRFLTADPSTPGTPDNPASWSMYAYVEGDPVNFNDPSGLAPMCVDDAFGGSDGTAKHTCPTGQSEVSVGSGAIGQTRLLPQLIREDALYRYQSWGVITGWNYLDPLETKLGVTFSQEFFDFALANNVLPAVAVGGVIIASGGTLEGIAGIGIGIGIGELIHQWLEARRHTLVKVTVRCQVIDNRRGYDSAVGYITAEGAGPDFATARLNALQNADAVVNAQYGVGFRKRHCQVVGR